MPNIKVGIRLGKSANKLRQLKIGRALKSSVFCWCVYGNMLDLTSTQ